MENAVSLGEINNVKKLKADGDYYRIRVGDYRIGIAVSGDVVIFMRILHRREVYRYFR
ncbi:type II toxin-antitoxin system RelE family toxin [Cylindrospermum stagnale]|uniref:type II toxin-antitoxin system RelE family toxin n=1 Tax=Cylindrospermum stagnale TaxID=142864 RepID=UPI0002F2CC55|nr:type II toxin-antitoxin system RelE/ParE family toxin [Cylindrospermum stagnale]